jgi:ribosome-associated translation inhibitor RaiA
MEPSDFVWNDVWDHAEKLERFYDRIMSCQVTVWAPHHHQHQGKIYHVKVRIHFPGGEINVTTEPEQNAAHEDVYVAIRDAFDAVRRRLEDFVRRQRGILKEKNVPAHAKVVRLFPDDESGDLFSPKFSFEQRIRSTKNRRRSSIFRGDRGKGAASNLYETRWSFGPPQRVSLKPEEL